MEIKFKFNVFTDISKILAYYLVRVSVHNYTIVHGVWGRNGSFSDLTSGGRILNFTGMP